MFANVLPVGFKKLSWPAFLKINIQLANISGNLENLSLLPTTPRF